MLPTRSGGSSSEGRPKSWWKRRHGLCVFASPQTPAPPATSLRNPLVVAYFSPTTMQRHRLRECFLEPAACSAVLGPKVSSARWIAVVPTAQYRTAAALLAC